jgi:transcriptional repressor NrdR
MFCPYCKSSKTKVVDKRASDENTTIRRRRECLKCKDRFTTYERAVLDMVVLKSNGSKEAFDRNKLRRGITKSCEKRPVSLREIERMVDDIESGLRQMHQAEIKSRTIGDLVMEKLKKLDAVAYVRFASYYNDFKNVQSFKKSLG